MSRNILSVSLHELSWKWFRRSALMSLFILPFVLIAEFLSPWLTPWTSLILIGAVILVSGGLSLFRVGLPPEFVSELLAKLPRQAGNMLAKIVH